MSSWAFLATRRCVTVRCCWFFVLFSLFTQRQIINNYDDSDTLNPGQLVQKYVYSSPSLPLRLARERAIRVATSCKCMSQQRDKNAIRMPKTTPFQVKQEVWPPGSADMVCLRRPLITQVPRRLRLIT